MGFKVTVDNFRIEAIYRCGTKYPSATGDDQAKADAAAIADRFPKSYRVKASTCSGPRDGDYAKGTVVEGHAFIHIATSGNDNNGGINEAGLKRFRNFVRKCDEFGIEIIADSVSQRYFNAYGHGWDAAKQAESRRVIKEQMDAAEAAIAEARS